MSTDYALLALSSSRAAFASACPFPFLVGRFGDAKTPRRHLTIDPRNPSFFEKTQPRVVAVSKAGTAQLAVLPVRKVQTTFPSMVSVGRTSNNDIVINDPLISKFHAFFRLGDDGKIELFEAGSKNGTWLGDKKLIEKEAIAVQSGDAIRFAELSFRFYDAGAAWEAIRKEPK